MSRRTTVRAIQSDEVAGSIFRRLNCICNDSTVSKSAPTKVLIRKKSATEIPATSIQTRTTRIGRSSIRQEQEKAEEVDKNVLKSPRTKRVSFLLNDGNHIEEMRRKRKATGSSASKEQITEVKRPTTRSVSLIKKIDLEVNSESSDKLASLINKASGTAKTLESIEEVNKEGDSPETKIPIVSMKKIEAAKFNSPQNKIPIVIMKRVDAATVELDLSLTDKTSLTEKDSTQQQQHTHSMSQHKKEHEDIENTSKGKETEPAYKYESSRLGNEINENSILTRLLSNDENVTPQKKALDVETECERMKADILLSNIYPSAVKRRRISLSKSLKVDDISKELAVRETEEALTKTSSPTKTLNESNAEIPKGKQTTEEEVKETEQVHELRPTKSHAKTENKKQARPPEKRASTGKTTVENKESQEEPVTDDVPNQLQGEPKVHQLVQSSSCHNDRNVITLNNLECKTVCEEEDEDNESQKTREQSAPLSQPQDEPYTVQQKANQISEQQSTMPRQQQEKSVHQQTNWFSEQQSTLKRSLCFHDQMQSSNKRQHLHFKQEESENFDHQLSLKLSHQKKISKNSRQLRQDKEKNLVPNPVRINNPPPHENFSLLHQLFQNSNHQPESTNQPVVNFPASPQFPSQPRMTRIFGASTEIISNDICADILFFQLYAYCKWVKNIRIYREAAGDLFTETDFKASSRTFRTYCNQIMLTFGNKIIRGFLPFDVVCLNIPEIFKAVSKKLKENGYQIGVFAALDIISNLIKPCKPKCTTPFTKKFHKHLTSISDNLEAKSRSAPSRSQNMVVWDDVNLKRLEKQIEQYHCISNWLEANLSNNTTIVPSTTIRARPSIQVQSHIVITPSGQDIPCQESPSTVPFQQSPNIIPSPVLNTSILPCFQEQSSATNAENKINAQEISAEQLPPIQFPRKEPDTSTDADVVDLTWIDQCDEDEIAEELKDSKEFLVVKVETCGENISSPVREVKSINPYSGCGSRQFQNDYSTRWDEYLCWCGSKAILECLCEMATYCSSECQAEDWSHHRNLCKRIQSNKQ